MNDLPTSETIPWQEIKRRFDEANAKKKVTPIKSSFPKKTFSQEEERDAWTYIILSLLNLLIGGWTILKLWEWFVSSTFQIKKISFFQAQGLNILVSYLTNQTDIRKIERSERKDPTTLGSEALGLSFGILTMGWVVHILSRKK